MSYRRLGLVIHLSLDGFVSDKDGSLDGFEPGEENLGFVCDITDSADTALLGRISWQMLNEYWPFAGLKQDAGNNEKRYSKWYNNALKVIVSRTIPGPADNSIFIKDNWESRVKELKSQAGKDILVFGSPAIARSLMEQDLVDDYWIFINPVLFGKGISLFEGCDNHRKLNLVSSRQFANGEIVCHYTV